MLHCFLLKLFVKMFFPNFVPFGLLHARPLICPIRYSDICNEENINVLYVLNNRRVS